ncbi:MAG TPA: hypothetical protein VMP01_04565 [Pirellulaceae bacterium]|nr:hypothetical protein [Pirellulaceae bacterium]
MPSALEILRDPYLQVTYLFVTGVAAIYCLIGLWAATSRRHWSLRAIIPCLALAALIPIRAHEPLNFYALIMAEIVLAMTIWRWWRGVGPACRAGPELPSEADARSRSASGTYQRFRFSLRDLFLLMVVVGVIAWIVTGFARVPLLIEWPGAIGASFLLAALTIAAWNLVSGRRPLAAALWLAAIFAAAIATDIFWLGDWLGASLFLQTAAFRDEWTRDLVLVPFLYGEFALLLLFGMGLARAAFSIPDRPRRRLAACVLLATVVLAAAVPLATLYWRMTARPDFPPAVQLSENVLPEVLRIGAPLENATPAQTKAIYEQLLPLLERAGYVTFNEMDAASDPFNLGHDDTAIQVMKIARALERYGESLELAGQHEQSAQVSLSLLKLSRMAVRGGFEMDVAIGITAEGIGRKLLVASIKRLSRNTKVEAVRLLAELDENREPMEVVARREHAYGSRGRRWRMALEYQLPYECLGLAPRSSKYVNSHIAHINFREQAARRLLMTELAIRLFEEDDGRLPRSLDELVPGYLTAIPLDPYGNLAPGVHGHVPPMVRGDVPERAVTYHPQGDEFLLYSIGQDCKDNGGRRMLRGESFLTTGVDWDVESLHFKFKK